MQNFKRQAYLQALALVVVAVLGLSGCIASRSQGGTQQTTVSISPGSATVSAGHQQKFSATVTGPQITAVTWNVNGIPNGNAILGTIDPAGIYTAPNVPPSPNTVSITAAAVANNTLSAPSTVTITPSNIAVIVSPASVNVAAGATQQFNATVSGTTDQTVAWQVNGILNGNTSVGNIVSTSPSTGLYTAPASIPSGGAVVITAVSEANPGISGIATATIFSVSITISPTPVSLPVSGTQPFTASVSGTSNSAVSWQVNGIPGGDSSVGTVVNGLYAAPAALPSTLAGGSFAATITAVSLADNVSSASAIANVHVTVTINGPPNDLTGNTPGTIGIGANWQYTATVNGVSASNQGINWRASAAQGRAGSIDPASGFYIAPIALPSQQPVSITATSQFDPQQFASANLTIEANDPLGTMSTPSALPTCLGDSTLSATATCYQSTITCPGVADIVAYLKVNTPVGSPLGTALFAVDNGGSGLYDDRSSSAYAYGSEAVQNVLNANFNTVQISFGAPFAIDQPDGWLRGPGGIRRLACRYATLANSIYNDPKSIALKLRAASTTSAPMCATGNGGGGSAMAYAVYEYGLGPDFAMIELTSGPTMSRIDQGCSPCSGSSTGPVCSSSSNTSAMCYGSGDASVVDLSYSANQDGSGRCTNALNGTASANDAAMFLSDSILSAQEKPPISLLNTTVNLLFGPDDTTSAVPQGMVWEQSVLPGANSKNPPFTCMQNPVAHDIPNYSNGAIQVGTDLINLCH